MEGTEVGKEKDDAAATSDLWQLPSFPTSTIKNATAEEVTMHDDASSKSGLPFSPWFSTREQHSSQEATGHSINTK